MTTFEVGDRVQCKRYHGDIVGTVHNTYNFGSRQVARIRFDGMIYTGTSHHEYFSDSLSLYEIPYDPNQNGDTDEDI